MAAEWVTYLHSINTSTAIVEPSPVATLSTNHRAPNVTPTIGTILIAYTGFLVCGWRECACPWLLGIRVHGHEIGINIIEAFNNVNFSVGTLVLSDCPTTNDISLCPPRGREHFDILTKQAKVHKYCQAYERSHR